MDLRQIRYFLELAKHEHVSRTADILNITQPTLSKSIHLLESEMGIQLFDRLGNRIRLNENGKRFYDYADKAIRYLDAGTLDAKRKVYDTTGHIGIQCWCFAPILWPCVAEYQRLNPFTSFTLFQTTYDNQNLSFDQQGNDFILRAYYSGSPSDNSGQFWIRTRLFSEETVLVMGPAFPRYSEFFNETQAIDLRRLSDAPFVTMNMNNFFFTETTYQICQANGFWPRTFFQTDDFLIKMRMIRSGSAIAFLPTCCLDDALLLCPGLKVLRVRGYEEKRSVCLLRKKKAILSEMAQDFYAFLLDYYNLPPDERE